MMLHKNFTQLGISELSSWRNLAGTRFGYVRILSFVALFTLLFVSLPAQAQDVPVTTTTGTVTSYTSNTLVVKTQDGQYRLFVFDRHTVKPAKLPMGSGIRVTSSPTDDPAVQLAVLVTALETPPPAAAPSATTQAQPDVVPPSVRNVEHEIERSAKKYKFGLQGGVDLDPELIDIGVNARFGPFFSRNLSFRPSVEFAYGEVTRMFGLNADIIYNLPFNIGARKYVYLGGGPGFNFVEESFNREGGVSFSDFHYSTALNILLGIQHRSGLFYEIKAGVYAAPAPVLHLTVGYTF
jgi:hypothetical protein